MGWAAQAQALQCFRSPSFIWDRFGVELGSIWGGFGTDLLFCFVVLSCCCKCIVFHAGVRPRHIRSVWSHYCFLRPPSQTSAQHLRETCQINKLVVARLALFGKVSVKLVHCTKNENLTSRYYTPPAWWEPITWWLSQLKWSSHGLGPFSDNAKRPIAAHGWS